LDLLVYILDVRALLICQLCHPTGKTYQHCDLLDLISYSWKRHCYLSSPHSMLYNQCSWQRC